MANADFVGIDLTEADPSVIGIEREHLAHLIGSPIVFVGEHVS